MRVNKYISDSGHCSRREADTLIAAGRVAINGQIAKLGMQVGEGDNVTVDGAVVGRQSGGRKAKRVYIAFHKPEGVTSTTAADVRGNIVDFIGHEQRIYPIGRLDKDSEGLILLTNHGDIVNDILRAEHKVEKEYVVTVNKAIGDDILRQLSAGVPILDTVTQPCRVGRINKSTFDIVLTQGLNRQIRRMCEHFGYRVERLVRVRIANIQLGRLKPGQWRNLTPPELQKLLPGKFA